MHTCKSIIMKSIKLKSFFLLCSTALLWVPLCAQTDKELLKKVATENQKAVDALVMYPSDTRRDILEVALYPDALIKIENIQSETAASFKRLVEFYSKETQESIWSLTRYPVLIQAIVKESGGSKKSMEQVLSHHPAEIRDKALTIGLNHFSTLQEIQMLTESTESAYRATIGAYPPTTQQALNNLLALPEVLSLLTESIRLTILAGDLYRKEPEWTLQKTDSLHLAVARRNAEELENWKKSLENNPQAKTEFAAAARAYAGEKDPVSDDLYANDDDDWSGAYEPDQPAQVVERHYYHYPYWFGYPWWYDYPRWRPYPWWWDWGFYYGPGRSVVVVNLPSYHFTNWYFYHPWHHDRWSHLSGHFVHHYHRHHDSGNSITTSVTVWRRRQGTIINDNWLMDNDKLPDRFREYGQFEAGRIKYNRDNPRTPLDQRDYLDRNANRYPELTKARSPRTILEEPVPKPRTQPPAREPYPNTQPFPNIRTPRTDKRPEKEDKKPRTNGRQPIEVLPGEQKPEVEPTRRPRIIQPDVNKGREHHENAAERVKTKERVTPREPLPKVQPPKKDNRSREKS